MKKPMTHDEILEAVQADKDGEQVEGSYDGNHWHNCDPGTHFNFADKIYRVKTYTAADYLAGQVASGLKGGDRVRVTRTAKTHEKGWGDAWVRDMNECVGEVRTIDGEGSRRGFNLTGTTCSFPYFVLEKVEPKVIWVNLQEEASGINPHCGYDRKEDAQSEHQCDHPIRAAVKFIEVID